MVIDERRRYFNFLLQCAAVENRQSIFFFLLKQANHQTKPEDMLSAFCSVIIASCFIRLGRGVKVRVRNELGLGETQGHCSTVVDSGT